MECVLVETRLKVCLCLYVCVCFNTNKQINMFFVVVVENAYLSRNSFFLVVYYLVLI